MSLSLAGNWRDELLRSRLLKDLPAERVTALWPDLDPSSPTTLAAGPSEVPLGLAQTLLAQIDAHAPPTLASNVWVIDGQHTASGQPLLASDPHLGFQAPVLWYLARLEWPGGQLAGATAPGVPFTIIGHNGHAAWGMTTTHADLQDLFIERVTADGRYDTPDGPQAFAIREEVLDIRFGEPEALTVRTTRHGPVVSDLDAFSSATSPDIVLALSATMLRDDDGTANAVYAIGQSRTVAEIKAALAGFEGPQQNFMYADTSGGIGFSSPALVPIRKAGDGTVPVPGWSGDYDWQGWVSYDDLPHSLNPEGGRLVNANNRPVPPDYPHLIAATFPEGYRAQRILDLLQEIAPGAATWQDMLGIQIDSRSEMARDLLPFLINVVEPRIDTAKRALALVAAWDGTMDRARPEPLLFLTWMDFVKEELLADDLGTAFTSFFGDHPILIRTALTDDPSWCGGTLDACSDVVSTAFERSLGWLSQRDETAAKDLSEWRWGDFHRARFSHPVFGFVPILSGLTTLEIETDGADHTVNRGGFRSARGRAPFRHSHGAGGMLGGQAIGEGAMQSQTGAVSVVALPPPTIGQGGEDLTDPNEGPSRDPTEEDIDEALRAREQAQFEQAADELEQLIQGIPELDQLSDSLMIDNTPEGLRIQIVDQDGLPLFPSGSAAMYGYTRRIIGLVARVVSRLPNEISISGHTDATPFNDASGLHELGIERRQGAGNPADAARLRRHGSQGGEGHRSGVERAAA